MADFMQNRMDPIEPVNFGIADAAGKIPDALLSAYKYLQSLRDQAAQRVIAPTRAMVGAVGEARARGQDFLTNQALSLIDTKRANPDANLIEAQDAAAPAYDDLSQIGKGASSLSSDAMDAIENARRDLIKKAGLIDTRKTAPTIVKAAETPGPWSGPVDQFGQPNGALPADPRRAAAKRRALTPQTPGGALPADLTQLAEPPGNSDFNASDANRVEGGGINPLPPRAVEPPQKGLREQFQERIAGMNAKAPAGMTDEQKGQALMEAGLAIMASASKPGASALGAVGEGGLKGTAVAREMKRINRERADKSRSEARADVRTEFDLAGKDADRADRKEDKAEGREIRRLNVEERAADRKASAANESRRIELLGQQIEAAGWQLKDGADGKVHAYNVRTNEDRVTPLKARPDHSGRNQQIEFINYVMSDPKRMAAYKEMHGEKGGITDKDVIAQAVELTKSQTSMGGTDNPEAVLQRNIEAVKRAAGRPGAAPSREAQAAAVREQFRQKQITKEQAVQQLQKLGYQ